MIIKTRLGQSFDSVSEIAKKKAIEHNVVAEFVFNEVECYVDKTTNIKHLERDFLVALRKNWRSIGPYCLKEHHEDLIKETRGLHQMQLDKIAIKKYDLHTIVGKKIKVIKKDRLDDFCNIAEELRWNVGDEFVVSEIRILPYGIFLYDGESRNLNYKRAELV